VVEALVLFHDKYKVVDLVDSRCRFRCCGSGRFLRVQLATINNATIAQMSRDLPKVILLFADKDFNFLFVMRENTGYEYNFPFAIIIEK